jgi:hypothetical protein
MGVLIPVVVVFVVVVMVAVVVVVAVEMVVVAGLESMRVGAKGKFAPTGLHYGIHCGSRVVSKWC